MNVADACLSLWWIDTEPQMRGVKYLARILTGPHAFDYLSDRSGVVSNVWSWDGVPGHLAVQTGAVVVGDFLHPHFPYGQVVESDH